MTSAPDTLPPGDPRVAAIELAETWAVLVRTLALYPDGNDRVLEAAQRAQEALQTATVEYGGAVPVLLSRRELFAGGAQVALPKDSNLAWLYTRLERCRLAGAMFGSEVDAEGLLSFSRQLLDGYRRTQLDRDFELAAEEAPRGITPVEQRFEGSFREAGQVGEMSWLETLLIHHPAARTDPLALLLARNDRVRERIEALMELVRGDDPEPIAPVKGAELLTQVVHALPAEATHREEDLVDHTVQLLDGVAEELAPRSKTLADGLRGGLVEVSVITRALADICRRIFAREGLAPEELAQKHIEKGPTKKIAAWMRGHAQDDRVADDLDALLSEVEALPSPRKADLQLQHASKPTEQVGVYLHYLTSLESDEEAQRTHPRLAECLRTADDASNELLELYLAPLRESGGTVREDLPSRRLLEFLRRNELTEVLASLGIFSSATIVDVFPRHFVPWLDSLDLSRPDDRQRLAKVCRELGRDRVRAATEELGGPDGILTPWRSCQILSTPDMALGPLVRILLFNGSMETRRDVLNFVQSAAGDREESCLLNFLDASQVPLDYLAEMLDPEPDEAARERLRTRVADLLADFVEKASGQPRLAARRLEAIGWMGSFHSPRAGEVLRQLARRARLFRSDEEVEVQRAAREALRTHP